MSVHSTAPSQTRIGSFVMHSSSKSSGLINNCKNVLSEQAQRLHNKHATELELIDDVRTFIKVKCSLERDYCTAISKLCHNHLNKKYAQFESEKDSDVKSLFTVWQNYLTEEETQSKLRASKYEQMNSICDEMKHARSHKSQLGKKGLENYLKKMQEELLNSAVEIDKCRKLYFDEEHLARQARDKEEKIKKKKTGIFSKFTDLQGKKEKTSAHREASDIQSTMARNEYILALAAGNAHSQHYHEVDIPNLMQFIQDNSLGKNREAMMRLLESEIFCLNSSNEVLTRIFQAMEATSAEYTDQLFLNEPTSSCLRDTMLFEFDPCDNDTIREISTDHNAELALQHEISKWMTCFSKECRNLHRFNQQMQKCLNFQSKGKKTVDVAGVGMVEIESRIDFLTQQLRKCEISKSKAKARLLAIKQSGMPIEDLEGVINQIATEMRQTSLDVDSVQPLSRTPSVKSTTMSDGRISSMENKSCSDDQPETAGLESTPEPKEKVSSDIEAPESPIERESAPSFNYDTYDPSAAWSDYDANAAWGDTSADEQPTIESFEPPPVNGEDFDSSKELQETEQQEFYQVAVDGLLVGKRVRALYDYNAQGEGELSLQVGQILTVLSAEDKDWVTGQTENYETGFIPAAFVEIIEDLGVSVDNAPVNGFPEPTLPPEPQINQDQAQVSETVPPPPQIQTETGKVSHVRALYDYSATSGEEISFKEGDLLKIIEKSEDGWWLAELHGVVGHFPSMLVEDIDEAEYEEEIEESGSLSEESLHDASPSGAPPPSFAPPKPAYLTPHSVVIIQPTPEVESRGTFGSEVEENVDQKQESCDGSDTPICPPPPPPPVTVEVDPEFSLDSPKKREEPVENKELDDPEDLGETNLEETEDTTDFASLPPPIDDEEIISEDKSDEPIKEKKDPISKEDERGQESENDFK
ncbi:FCH and double SH3 domains nervous wreck isoform X2 [Brevipalpus obovatus]|uniref:FCH and double SH3 domains nervous wreck isoform X2 n=1 Tax=Brevipalpus obovatus TaxID=246614 RepID=UPI003D9F7377